MVHSVELLFDAATDAAVRRIWDDLTEAGIRSLAAHESPSNRPHVTLTVADHLDGAVDDALRPLLTRLPMPCVIGAPMFFGSGAAVTLVRLLVPSAELLALHADVHRATTPHRNTDPMPHTEPGHWTPHVTLARRLPVDLLGTAAGLGGVGRNIPGAAVALRHWDGNAKVEHRIG
ncbi:2'-5' RNA ligase family protein [Mycobacterium sp. SMC-4]|uniref:2'-5' RNA ligase family protein n=1 Tax=Mycobacterium sp. SMC-4 TaxID=2857059 RepID=UPI0021B3E973|nr:2'-5' RNA ligase family protein [Mycobacterium sp. SMC-4]UXA20312.1 2'-5' RNA ligase family protein [Mycobacterium sp. SMC-4]